MPPEKPPHIRKAMQSGNKEVLKAAQRKSVETRKKNEAHKKDLRGLAQEIEAEDEALMLNDAAKAELLHKVGEEEMEERHKESS